MKKRALFSLFALLTIAAVVAGCGGGSDSTGSTGGETGGGTEAESSGPAPSKATFIKEADKICTENQAEVAGEIVDYAKENDINLEEEPSDDQQVEIFEAIVIPKLNDEHDALAGLTPPAGEEDAVGELLESLESGIDDIESDPGQLVGGDSSPLEDTAEKAQEFGLTKCGNE